MAYPGETITVVFPFHYLTSGLWEWRSTERGEVVAGVVLCGRGMPFPTVKEKKRSSALDKPGISCYLLLLIL
jgi:hypothetical protein